MHNFTRKNLEAMGLEKEMIDKLVDLHMEDVTDFQQRERELKDKAESGDTKLADDFEKLKSEFETYKQNEVEKATRAAKATAVKAALKSAGISAKHLDKIARLYDVDSVEMEGEKIKDMDAFIKNAKTEWSDFVETQSSKGADVSHPPKLNEGGTTRTPEKIVEMKDTTKRQAAWDEYLENERKE